MGHTSPICVQSRGVVGERKVRSNTVSNVLSFVARNCDSIANL